MASLEDKYGEAAINPFYKGCTATELAQLFKMPMQTVRDSLREVPPCGKRAGRDIYTIPDAAMVLIREAETDAEQVRRILKLHHTDLPKMLSKEFWLAETHRQRYMVAAGDLWPTTKVVEWLSEAYKTIRLSLMLMADTVERQETLTNTQRDVIVALVDATLNDAADRLNRGFKNQRKDAVSGPPPPEEDDDNSEL